MIYQTNKREVDRLTGRRLDDSRLAHPGSIKVDVGALLGSFSFDIQIQQLDDIPDKVR